MWQSLKRFAGLLPPRQRWQAALLVVMLIGGALLEMVGLGLVPLYIGILVDPERLLRSAQAGRLMAALGLTPNVLSGNALLYGGSAVLLVIFTAKLVYAPLLAYARARYIDRVVQAQSVRLFRAYMLAPYQFHLGRHSAELLRNISAECTRLGESLLGPLINMVSQLIVTLAIIGLLVMTVPGIALVATLLLAVVTLPLVASLNRRVKRLSLAAQDGRKRVTRTVQEGLGGVKELALLGRQDYFVGRFRAALREVLRLQRFLQVQSVTLPVLMEWLAVVALLLVVVILFGAQHLQAELLGMVALFAVAMARLKGSINGVIGSYAQVRAGLDSADIVVHDLRQLESRRRPSESEALEGRVRLRHLASGIGVDDVWFRYTGSDKFALRGISLTIRKGEAIGFVGPSGGGKSTLVDVILGILAPQRGSVSFDGQRITESLRDWHRMIGYIPQSIYLIDGTIRQNVALGLEDSEISESAIQRAVSAASLDEFIGALPEGLDTVVGERGVRLSGGQRQRIAIARALYNDPDILIMDEATAALDNVTEKAVMEAVDALKGRRTILMIAHRLSTVRNCDRVVFLDAGEVAGSGTFDELAESHDAFKRMANVT